MDLPYREEKRHTTVKTRHKPTATKNKDQTLQKLSGDWSTSGKIHDCFMMMMMATMTAVGGGVGGGGSSDDGFSYLNINGTKQLQIRFLADYMSHP